VNLIAASPASENKIPLRDALAIFGISGGPWVDSCWVYFPVPDHLARARKGEDFAVAYQPPFTDDMEWDQAPGFSPEGRRLRLDPWVIPSFPVLAITLEPPDTLGGGFPAYREPDEEVAEPLAAYHKLIAKAMKLYVRPEPWILGALEIYTWCYRDGSSHRNRKDFKEVNYRYILYTFACETHELYDIKVEGSGAYYPVEIWEDDRGNPDDHIQNFDIGYYCSEFCESPSEYYGGSALLKAYYWTCW